jgi:predicted nuclease with RNAse H fold
MKTQLYVGFDPGGKGHFGWCLAKGSEKPRLTVIDHGIAKHAKDAVDRAFQAAEQVQKKISAVGIDAPLFWRPDGGRQVDKKISDLLHGRKKSSVIAVNSLRGACLVQGMMAAMLIRNKCFKIPITESHPKALLLLKKLGKRTKLSKLGDYFNGDVAKASDDERDAAIAALSAWAMICEPKGWQDLYQLEQNKITPLEPPPAYWMPV